MAELEPIYIVRSSPKSDSPMESPISPSKFGRRPSKDFNLSPRLGRRSENKSEEDSKLARKSSKVTYNSIVLLRND
jgi:hypothetical protein